MKALAAAVVLWAATAAADPPYKMWWSFPLDDESAIEVDDSDVGASDFQSRWQLAVKQACERRVVRDDPTLRELRVETLGGDGQVRTNRRCVRTLADWKKRLGARMVERLDDELDAHVAFLHPRKQPGDDDPARANMPKKKPKPKDAQPKPPSK